jgi:hypothetical protein
MHRKHLGSFSRACWVSDQCIHLHRRSGIAHDLLWKYFAVPSILKAVRRPLREARK